MRELVSAYNCVLATVYNYLADIYGYKFPVEAMYITPKIFELARIDGILVTASPEYIVNNFLENIDAEMSFPVMKGLEEAIAFADEHLMKKGIVPVNINLRYDILDPLPFDNDYWHIHLMVERLSPNQFRMFDQFENEYYTVNEEHLKKAIDTDFNYRFGGFTPFMFINVPTDRQAITLRKLESLKIEWNELKAVIAQYPFESNVQEGLMFLAGLEGYRRKKPDAGTMYRIMNYLLIIAKSRDVYVRCLEKNFNISGREPQLAEELNSVYQRWMEYRNLLGMALTRRKAEGFAGLEHHYEALIEYEYDTFGRVLRCLEAEGLSIISSK